MLHGDHSALLTTDPDLAIPFAGFSDYPAGVSDTVQVIGTGSGATPGHPPAGRLGTNPGLLHRAGSAAHYPV